MQYAPRNPVPPVTSTVFSLNVPRLSGVVRSLATPHLVTQYASTKVTEWSFFYDQVVMYARHMAPARSGDVPVTPKGRGTKDALLDAGEAVAARDGHSGLSVTAVTSRAGVAKGTFYVYFPDRAAFIEALDRRFYDRVAEAVLSAVAPLAPGRDLLIAAVEAYLDVCLAQRAVKALILEARVHSARGAAFAGLLDQFTALMAPSMEAIGMTPVGVHARLLVALASEVALMELERGSSVDEARAGVRAMLRGS
jgi:TetR/AcrR family transcriptional regulator, transcriptional repressor for nem operon